MQAALERRLADARDLRRVVRGEAFDVAQHHGGAPVVGKLIQRTIQRTLELAVERLRLGAELRRLRQRDDRVVAFGSGSARGGGRRDSRR